MSRMKESPRRPIILKRRKLPFQRNEPDAPRTKVAPTAGAQSFPDGIHIMDHPAMPDTQVVVIPKTADLQSVIDALTTKGKERGAQGPNKFILLSGSGGVEQGADAMCSGTGDAAFGLLDAVHATSDSVAVSSKAATHTLKSDVTPDSKALMTRKLKVEGDGGPLDESLTNIQWLGKMSTCPDLVKNESNKENLGEITQCQQARLPEEEMVAVKVPLSERPPYSYMAMIQFAINSDKNKRMTLKEIYNWIEDHFPYFRNVAKPGWKNSIRHNLSLHDMFVRETTADGKTSYWTIKPESNRYLTLDQVYKPVTEPAAAPYLQTTQVCYQQQQKRLLPDLRKATPGTTERKMKPLLPRTDSYLVPIQLPLTQSLFLPSSAALPLSTPQNSSSYTNHSSIGGGKRVRIAPKVQQSESSSVAVCTPAKQVKEESICFPICTEPCSSKRKELSSSRRKQRLFPPSTEEPVLLFPDSTFFDSGLASDISAFHEAETEVEPEQRHEAQSESESCTFKTPIKSSHPPSSTPSKALEPWKVTPLGKGSCSMLDFSPIRTPQRPEQATLSFSGTPFKDLPLFSSPRELLTSCPRDSGPANRSFTEGLVLDTMNDSLSKILVDISFSALEDDDLGMANISWSQFIPDLK